MKLNKNIILDAVNNNVVSAIAEDIKNINRQHLSPQI